MGRKEICPKETYGDHLSRTQPPTPTPTRNLTKRQYNKDDNCGKKKKKNRDVRGAEGNCGVVRMSVDGKPEGGRWYEEKQQRISEEKGQVQIVKLGLKIGLIQY